jgi:hypothetical protein
VKPELQAQQNKRPLHALLAAFCPQASYSCRIREVDQRPGDTLRYR